MEEKEAMKILKEFHDKSALFSVRTALETIIPELKESEDENIIEEIKDLVKSAPLIMGLDKDKIFAWLEKQGKNNMGISETTKKKLEDNLNKALEKETPEPWNKFLEKQGEQKPTEWGEEDKKMKNLIISTLSSMGTLNLERYHHMNLDEVKKWLKSLKDRVQPQLKQELNEKNIADVFEKVGLAKIVREQGCDALTRAVQSAMIELSKFTPQPKENIDKQFESEWSEEDDRIRKELIKVFSNRKKYLIDQSFGDITVSEAIAWLEKQGEQKPADKVELKFKVGDWVVRGKTIAQILDIQERYYVGLDIEGNDFTSSRFLSDDKIHLWTIKDAKDGDVLACGDKVTDCPFIFHNLTKELNPRSYCGVNTSCCFQCNDKNGGFWCDSDEVRPATKEQCELLFSKMKEAGYEWDAKMKELKKIEL